MARPKLPRDAHGQIIRAEVELEQAAEPDLPPDLPPVRLDLMDVLTEAGERSRLTAPHGTEANLLAIALRVAEIRTLLPLTVPYVPQAVADRLTALAALL